MVCQLIITSRDGNDRDRRRDLNEIFWNICKITQLSSNHRGGGSVIETRKGGSVGDKLDEAGDCIVYDLL